MGRSFSLRKRKAKIAEEGSSSEVIIEVETGPIRLIASYNRVNGIISQKNAKRAAFFTEEEDKVDSFSTKLKLKINRTISENKVV